MLRAGVSHSDASKLASEPAYVLSVSEHISGENNVADIHNLVVIHLTPQTFFS